MTTPRLIPLTDLAGMREAGITYPCTIHSWRWLFRQRHERGLDDAFRRVGKRILLDAPRFIELVRGGAES